MKKIIAMLLITPSLYAAQQCTTLDASAYSNEQINHAPMFAHQIAVALDNTSAFPSMTYDAQKRITICFDNVSFDVAANITIPALVNKYNAQKAAEAAYLAQVNAWMVQLSTTTTALNNARIAGFKNLTAANQAATVQGLLDREYLKILLGIDEK